MPIFKEQLLNERTLLYVVDHTEIERYKQVVLKYKTLLIEAIPSSEPQLNIFVSVCDIWIALKTYSFPIILDQQKTMSFPPAALQLKLLEENVSLKNYVLKEKLSSDEQFVLAYFVSFETMHWLSRIMEQANRSDLIEHYVNSDRYDELFQDFDDELFISEMNNQTVFVKAMMKNVRETNDFPFAINNAISKTKLFLTKKM